MHPLPPPRLRLSRALGWLSFGSGVALLVAPRPLGRLYGLPSSLGLLRALGVRDLIIGAGLLREGPRRAWLVARALSDALDTALIAADARRGDRSAFATAGRLAIGLGTAVLSSSLAADAGHAVEA